MTVNRLLLPSAVALYAIVAVARGVAAPAPSPASPPVASQAAAREATAEPAATGTAAQQAPRAGYAGQDVCVTCHEGFDDSINKTPHGFARNPRTPSAALGCESCHGPGEAHTQDPENVKPRSFLRVAAVEVNDTCTTCHNRGDHTLWSGSQHEARNLSCVTCHSVHTPKSAKGQLKAKDQSSQCANCHRDKVNKLDRSGHMPVREGKLECTSCHNVHGSRNVRLLRAGFTINETCATCHADKRGPFLWEHGPVRESCVSCHDPHGSSNERMLVAKSPFLCQRCHNHTRHPATIYDRAVQNTSNRIFGRSCASCHTQIHGSNHPSGNFLVR